MSELFASLLAQLDLSTLELAVSCSVVFLAGCVRGFAGFGLSAIAMACLVLILPPVELIPVLYFLEGSASVAMFKGGLRDADMGQVKPLAIGSVIGIPIGLLVTTTASPESSRLIAVLVILALTVLQFARQMPAALRTIPGRYAVGATAGIVTGICSAGGMVIALYALASKTKPRDMRAVLTMYLFIGMFTSLAILLLYGVMTSTAFLRGAILIPFVLMGVFFGSFAFRPSLERFYRIFCLVLLVAICLASLGRMSFA